MVGVFNSIGEVNEVAIERWFHSFIHSFHSRHSAELANQRTLAIVWINRWWFAIPASRSMISSCAIGNNEKRFTVAFNWINWSHFEVFIHKVSFASARTRLEDFCDESPSYEIMCSMKMCRLLISLSLSALGAEPGKQCQRCCDGFLRKSFRHLVWTRTLNTEDAREYLPSKSGTPRAFAENLAQSLSPPTNLV